MSNVSNRMKTTIVNKCMHSPGIILAIDELVTMQKLTNKLFAPLQGQLNFKLIFRVHIVWNNNH